jgi:hypothetical protein
VIGNAWSYIFTGLPLGVNTFSVVATSPTGDEKLSAPPSGSIHLLPTAFIFGEPVGAVKQTSATMTVGATDAGGRRVDFYKFKLDNGAYGGDIPVADPFVLSNLSDGAHSVSVIVRDIAGNQQPETSPTTVRWTVKANPPVISMESFPLPTRETRLLITGTISELGPIPQVTVDTGATAGPVSVVPGSGTATWSCELSGLKKGTNNITVTATDIAQNVATATTGVTIILPDGCFKGTAAPDITDALKALHIAVGNVDPTLADKLHGDVAPLVNNAPAPDGTIGVEDALVILKRVVNLVNF